MRSVFAPGSAGHRALLAHQLALLLALIGCGTTLNATSAAVPSDTQAAPDAGATDTSHSDTTETDTSQNDSAQNDTAQTDTAKTPQNWPLRAPTVLGGKRPAKLLVPKSYTGKTALPVVFLLGGYDYLSQDLDDWILLSERVDSAGFALVMPDGLIDLEGSPYWNATDICCDYDGVGTDDVGYLTGLLNELQKAVFIDPKRVAFVGHSAGGFMAYRMACELPDRIAAVVSIAGAGFIKPAQCHAKQAVSVLQVHGDKDDIMPFGGDDGVPGALEMMSRWATRAGCDTLSWQQEPAKQEYIDDKIADETSVFAFTKGCAAGIDVRLWKVQGSDHYPEFRPAFTDAAIAWLLAHPRP